MPKSKSTTKSTGISTADILSLPDSEKKLVNWLRRQQECTLKEIAQYLQKEQSSALPILEKLEATGFVQHREVDGLFFYSINFKGKTQGNISGGFWKKLEKKVGSVKFSTLIVLTLITAALLTPFAFSSVYLANIRDNSFDLYQIFQQDLYKQITGYVSLAFVIFEMIITARKRGRGWLISLKIPGSIPLWRSLHIFVGVALVGVTLIHTVGATGLNFNAAFLWVFFAAILSALVGVVAEVGVLESPQKNFTLLPNNTSIKKGPLLRNLRLFWISTHIILVSGFLVMLVFHIFLAYYYQ